MQEAAWKLEMRMRRNGCGYWRTISNCATCIIRSASVHMRGVMGGKGSI